MASQKLVTNQTIIQATTAVAKQRAEDIGFGERWLRRKSTTIARLKNFWS